MIYWRLYALRSFSSIYECNLMNAYKDCYTKRTGHNVYLYWQVSSKWWTGYFPQGSRSQGQGDRKQTHIGGRVIVGVTVMTAMASGSSTSEELSTGWRPKNWCSSSASGRGVARAMAIIKAKRRMTDFIFFVLDLRSTSRVLKDWMFRAELISFL